MEGYHGAECDRASETSSFVEDEEDEEEEEEEEEEEDEEAAVGPEEAEELTNSLKDLIQSEDVKPKLQYIMTNPSFSMVTVQSEDSGITWETSSSRCSTPWASETSTTSDLYSMESSPVGSPPGKVVFIMDEGKIVRKRKRKPANRLPVATSLKGGQGNKKRDSSGMQRQEPRTVLGDVQASVLNVEEVEAEDADEEMLDDKEDLENIMEEPVKRAPIRSIFRESRLRKVGPILGGPVQARIQLFNAIFGGTEPTPETLDKNKIQRSSSVSGDSEQFLETSVKERLQKFKSLSQATHLKSFPKALDRNLETPSQRRRGQRQAKAHANQGYSSPTPPPEKWFTNKGDVSSENIKPMKTKDKPHTSSSSGAEATLQHEEQKDGLSLSENLKQVSEHSLKSCPPEEARKQQSYSPVDKRSITEQNPSISLESDDKSEKQLPLPSAENSNKERDESLLTALDHLNEPREQEMQPSSTPQSISADLVNELKKESIQTSLPTASMAEHPERDAQKSAVQSSLPSTPSAKSKSSTLSEARQEDILPQTSETAQSKSEHLLLPHSVDEPEKQEAECHSSNALTGTGHSDLFHSSNKEESQQSSPQETQNAHSEKQIKSRQDLSSSFQETGEQGIKLNSSIPEKTDSKYFGISYPTHTETEETWKTSATNETIDLDHSGLSNGKNKQTENAQMEMEHPDFSYSSEEIGQSERTQLEIEHPDFSFFKDETEELEGVQMEMEHPDFSFSSGEMEEPESEQLDTEHPDFLYARKEMGALEHTYLEAEQPDFSYSREEVEESESSQLEKEYPELLFSMKEREELESTQLEAEQSDFSYSREEVEESESSQLEKEHPELLFSMKEREELESTQLEAEQPDFSYSREEVEESESSQQEKEHPELLFSMKEELESTQLEREQPDFSYSREEVEESESSQLEKEYPELLFSMKEREELESTQLEAEQPDFSYSMEEKELSESSQKEKEHPELLFSMKEREELESTQLEAEQSDFSYSVEETEVSESSKLEKEHPELLFSMKEREELESTQLEAEQPDFSYSMEEKELSESSQKEKEHPELLFSMTEREELESTQLEAEQPDFSYSMEEKELSESSQQEKERPELLFSTEERGELESTQMETEQSDFSHSVEDTAVSESSQKEKEHPELLFSMKEREELESTQLEAEQPDFSYSMEEKELSESSQQEKKHPELLFSMKEREELESTQLEAEQPDFSCSMEETEVSESSQLEKEHLDFFPKENTEELENAQVEMKHQAFSYSRDEMVQSETAQLERGHPDLSLSREEVGELESAQLEMERQEFLFSREEGEKQKYIPFELEQSESYSPEEPEKEETAELARVPLSCLMEAEKENTTELRLAHPDTFGSTRRDDTGQTRYMETAHSDLPYCTNKGKQQELAQPDLENSLMSCFGDNREQLQPVQQDSQQGDKLYSHVKGVQEETTQMLSEHPVLSHFTRKEQQYKTSQRRAEQPETPFSAGETEQREILKPKLKQTDSLYSQEDTAQEAVQRNLEVPELSHFVSEAEQHDYGQLASENKDFSFTTEKVMQEGVDSGGSSHPFDRAKPWEMIQMEQEQLLPSSSAAGSQQQETLLLDVAKRGISYSFGRMGQEDGVQREIEQGQQETNQHKAMQMECSDLSETWGQEQPQVTDQVNLAQQEIARPELAHLSLPCSFSGQIQEEMQTEPAYLEQAFYVSKEMQEEVIQHGSEQLFLSHLMGKTEQQETVNSEMDQTVLSSSGREAPLEMKISSEAEQQHPTLPFLLKEEETTPPVMEQADFPWNSGKAKPDTIVEQESGHTEFSYSMGETQQPEALGEAAQHESMEVESNYSHLSWSDGQTNQQETSQLDSKYPGLSFSFGEDEEQTTQNIESKHQELHKVSRKRASPATAQIESDHPDLTYSPGKANEPEVATRETKYPDLPHSTDDTNQQEIVLLDQKYRKISVGGEKQHQATNQKLEQGKLPYSPSKTEHLKHAQEAFEQPDLPVSIDRPDDERVPSEAEHTVVIHTLNNTEVQQRVQDSREQTYQFGKAEQKTVQPEVERPHLAHALDTAAAEMVESGQEHTAVPVQTALLTPKHSDPACSVTKVQETSQQVLEEPDTLYVCDKKQVPPPHLQLGQADAAFPTNQAEQQGVEHTALRHPNEEKPLSRAEHPQAAKEKLEAPDASSHSGKSKQSEIAKPEPKQPDSSCFIGKTQETRPLALGKPDTSPWPGKTEQAKTAEDKQLGLLHSSKDTVQGEKAQPKLGCSQLSYSVSEAEKETAYAHMKSKDLGLSAGRLEHHEIIQPETEMDLSRSIDEAQHPQTAEVYLEYPESLHSTSMVQQQEKIQPEQEHPGDFLSSLSKEEQCESTGMQAEHPELQCSVGKREELQNSQAKSEHECLSFSLGTAEPHQSAQQELEEHDLLHFSVKTKTSWAASVESEHTDDAMGNVPHSNLSSSVSELKQSAQLEVRQERGSYTLHPEETVHLKLEQPLLSSSCVTAEQLKRAPLEAEFQGKKKQEMGKQESKHLDLSYSTDKTQRQEATQSGLGQTDLSSYPGNAEQPQTVQVYQDLENFAGKAECQNPAQTEVEHPEKELPSLSYSICKALSQEATQMDLGQQDLTYTLGKPDEINTVQAELKHSGLFSSGKNEQEMVLSESQHPEVSYSVKELEEEATHPKSSYADLSYSTGQQEYHKTEQAEGEEMGLSYPADKSEHFKPVKEQQPGLLETFDKLNDSIVEAEQSETCSLSYTFGRTEMWGSAQLDFEQAGLLSSSDKAEEREMAPLRAGCSEKQDTRAASSLTAQLETEQDLSFSTEEGWSQKIQPYSPRTELTPLGVSQSVSETKPKGSPKSGTLSPEHIDLTYTAPAESDFFFSRKEAENTKDNLHLPVAAQLEAEHITLPEREREQSPCYFHRATELESEQLNLSYSTDKEENLESQDYLAVPLKRESASSIPFYSADKTSQQGIAPYSKPASEYLVPTESLAEQEKQSMQSLIPQSPQSESKHTIPPHDEKEVQKSQLCSPKPASLKTVELDSVSLKHTQHQDKQQDRNNLLDQLSSPSKFSTKQSEQETQLDVQTVPSLVTTESRMTAVANQQAASSDSFATERSVSAVFTGYEETQNIPPSLADVVGMIGKQSNVISNVYTEQEEKLEMQPSFADQKDVSLEHPGAVSRDPFYETATHKTQHCSGDWGSPSSEEMKPISSGSDEKHNPDIPSFGLASWLSEEVKSRSISPARASGVDEQELPLSPNETSDFDSKQMPDAHCTELRVHGATKNKRHMFSVSHSASSKISEGMSLDTTHRTQRHDLPSQAGDSEGPNKAPEYETRIGTHTNMESMQHPEADKVSEVPAHYFRGEKKERDHVSTVEDSRHAPETTEQKDLFNIISEGYEILNIHAPKCISSVDQEESKHMPDKLEYLETNISFNRKLGDDGHRAPAAGTTTSISESSVLGKPASHEINELVKNDDAEELGEMQQENPMLPEDNDSAELDPNNGMADMDYFEKYTLIDDKSPVKPHFERPHSLFPVVEDPNEPVEEAKSLKESIEVDTLEEEFSFLEDVDEVFYGTVKGGNKMQSYADVPNPLPLQKSIDTSSKKVINVEDEQKSPGTPLFDTEEGVLERSLLFPTTVAAVNPELLEEPPALSFLYKDLYAEAVGEKTKDETPSDEESGKSNASFPSRNSDTDDGTGIYFEKYILKDEIPSKATGPLKNETPDEESFSGGISVLSSEDKHKQRSVDIQHVRTDVLPETRVTESEKIQVDSDIQATICKPIHAIPFGSKVIHSDVRTDTTEQTEDENVPEESTEELPEQSSHEAYSEPVDYQGATYQEAGNNQEEWHDTTAVLQMEKYVPYVKTPVEDTEDDQYAHENLSCIPAIQQTEKLDLQREEQHPDVYEDLAESMDYDVITQEELLQDEISSQLTHEELLFEDRYSFEHAGDSYELVNEPEQRTPVELEDSGFVVVYPDKSATNVPQIESPQRELKKAQADTYCYHCKCPISAIDKLFGEHKDHEVTTLDDAATKMKDQLSEMLKAVEEKSIKIEDFVSDIESLFNSVEENCKKNAELLEKQNEEMLKKVVAQYDEKSENFEEVKKMKMEYLYEQMVNFQQTVDSAKDTLDATVKEMEEIDGFVFLNSSKELNKRLLSAMDTTLSLEKVPSAFSLFEHYADSPGQSNQHSLKQVAVPQTPTLIPQEPNSATSTSIAIYWAVNEGDAIDCFQVYCMEEPQASKDVGALVEEYRVTVKESHCILEDLEPDHCYGVWVMAVNGTGCGLPSEKVIFKTAPAVPTIRAEDCTVLWDTATVRWHASSASAEFFSLEYCRQHSLEGEGLRSFTGIQRPELKVSLEPNVNYFFYLRAVNSFGTSEQSEAALISTKGTRFHLLSNTAHPALQISSNMIHLPEKTKFTGIPSVLGEQLPARGRHYWEIIVSACRSYRIGICYEGASQSSVLGLNDASWCMRCCPTQTSFLYRFLHTGVMSDVHVTEQPARIGILLDYSGSRLLFFNAEKGLVLFAVRHKFTDASHPAFALEKAGVLTLCTGMELPEFVKNS